jgi:hypothetical protein
LGVGIGLDYGIYLYSKIEGFLRQGLAPQEAFLESLKTTGTSIVFTGAGARIGACFFEDQVNVRVDAEQASTLKQSPLRIGQLPV